MISNSHDKLDQCVLVLRELSDAAETAQRYRFARGDMCIIDRGFLLGKLNEMFASLPDAVKQADEIVTNEKTLRSQAAAECESLLAKAREQARQTEAAAQQKLDQAAAEAQQVRAGAEHTAQETIRQGGEEGQRLIREGKMEADAIRQEAERQLREAVSRENVTRVAQVEADELRENTHREMDELHDNVFDYLNSVMGEIERFLSVNLQNVKTERKELNDHRIAK